MKASKAVTQIERATTLAASWVLLVAFAVAAVAVPTTLSLPLIPDRAGSWIFALCVSLMPSALVVLAVLTLRSLREPDAADLDLDADAAPVTPVKPAAIRRTVLPNLDQTLGVPQVQELRAHVDLLCTMAILERMGPDLRRRLMLWGIPGRAQQAAVSAELLQRLLSVPGLEALLHRCALVPGTPAFAAVQTDLQAIAASLHMLARQVQGDGTPPALVQGEIDAGETLMATMTPADRLLVQYAQLLTGVAAMARIIATSYEQLRESRFNYLPVRNRAADARAVEAPALAEVLEIPRWKLN